MTNERKQKKKDWTVKALEVAGQIGLIALQGAVFGAAGTVGQRLVEGKPRSRGVGEDGNVVSLKKAGGL